MRSANIHEAKSQLSKLVELAFQGEDVIICKAGKPVAKLVVYQEKLKVRAPGCWKGEVHMSEDFESLPEDMAAEFQGEGM